ncbi:MAG: hypothetical protein JWO22_1113 [Frankiales bacterium]|nr:hypothetical protein [Frankiales bacterium]
MTYPTPAPAAAPTGKELLRSTWSLLRQDRELLWLPVLATISALVAAIVLFVPGFALGYGLGNQDAGVVVGGALAAVASTAVAIYFQAALVIGANQRADGGDPTLRSVLAAAWALRVRILKWALLAATVGAVIRAAEQRLGLIGKLLGFLGGVAWAIATFLVVPVLVSEDLGPIDAVKRSSQVLKSTWGTSVRSTLRFGLIQLVALVPALVAVFAGAAVISSSTTAGIVLGLALILLGVLAILALSMVASAVTGYARALIYRYATGAPVPGISPALLAGAFAPKKSRRF